MPNHNNIIIFSRPVRSGKTTALFQFISDTPGVAGILTPDIEGKRMLYNIATGQYHEMEFAAGDAAVTIGRFSFSAAAFMQAQHMLREAAGAAWLIVDEAGPLEVRRNSGLEPVLSMIIKSYKEKAVAGYLLLVVRDTMVTEMKAHYDLDCLVTDSLNNMDSRL